MDLIYALITKHFKLSAHTSRSLTLNTGASRALIYLARWQHGTLAAAADMCTEWDICVADAPGSTAVTDLCVTLFHVCTRSRDTRAWKPDAIRLDILCHIFKCDSFRAHVAGPALTCAQCGHTEQERIASLLTYYFGRNNSAAQMTDAV